tara:strand:+ start:2415 stop:2690 length:276 start_codon:yes stop_codon:yes gene_type:complete
MSEKVILTGSSLVLSVFIRVKRLIVVRKNIKIMSKFKVITVLDFESGKVTQYGIDKWNIYTEDIETFLFNNDHNVSNCQWMVHEDATIYVK